MAAQTETSDRAHRFFYMLALVVAGEAVFALPFHVARFFRPAVLDTFSITATELGKAQGLYGIVAMVMYFFGGPFADRYPARKLLAVSLWITAAGGLYMATFPTYKECLLIWGFFGVSTILLFWAALIRATREWGDTDTQGRAYGLLDSGRGALAAALGSLGVILFGFMFPEGYDAASMADRKQTLRIVIYGYTVVTLLAGIFVWFVIKDAHGHHEDEQTKQKAGLREVVSVLKLPTVWMQAIIVVCAYVSYKGFDNYALFAEEAYRLDGVQAAKVVAIGAWMRPVAALAAGLLGDRAGVARMTLISFALLLLSHLTFAFFEPSGGIFLYLVSNTLVAAAAMFGLRGLYFALFEDAKVPLALTGTAVGVVSVIGFTPDVFVSYVAGRFVDTTPGLVGHQHFFLFMAAFAAIGVVATYLFMRLLRRN